MLSQPKLNLFNGRFSQNESCEIWSQIQKWISPWIIYRFLSALFRVKNNVDTNILIRSLYKQCITYNRITYTEKWLIVKKSVKRVCAKRADVKKQKKQRVMRCGKQNHPTFFPVSSSTENARMRTSVSSWTCVNQWHHQLVFSFPQFFQRSELTLNQSPEPISNPRMYTNSNLLALALHTTPTGGSAARRRFNAAAPHPQTDPIESVTALVVILLVTSSIVTALATAAIVMTSSDATESDEETVLLVSKSLCIALLVLLLSRN